MYNLERIGYFYMENVGKKISNKFVRRIIKLHKNMHTAIHLLKFKRLYVQKSMKMHFSNFEQQN